jgi:hypothetical protein
MDHLDLYMKQYPADYLRSMLMMIGLGATHKEIIQSLEASLSKVLWYIEDFELLLSNKKYEELHQYQNSSGILLYGGVTLASSAQGNIVQPASTVYALLTCVVTTLQVVPNKMQRETSAVPSETSCERPP